MTYQAFKDYWPPIADDPKADPIEREISRLNNAIEKVVVSDSLTAEDAYVARFGQYTHAL